MQKGSEVLKVSIIDWERKKEHTEYQSQHKKHSKTERKFIAEITKENLGLLPVMQRIYLCNKLIFEGKEKGKFLSICDGSSFQ